MGRAAHNTKTKIIALVVAVLLLVGGGGVWLANRSAEPAEQDSATVQTEEIPGVISYDGQEGRTALELLKEQAEVETEDSDFGEFVKAINGEDGGGDKYWIFYADGQMASVGAGEYQTKDGETIEWKLQ